MNRISKVALFVFAALQSLGSGAAEVILFESLQDAQAYEKLPELRFKLPIILKSKQGHYFVVEHEVLEQSSTLQDLLEDAVLSDPLVVKDLDDETLEIVCAMLIKTHKKHPDEIGQIAKKYLGNTADALLDKVIEALNYLNVGVPLLAEANRLKEERSPGFFHNFFGSSKIYIELINTRNEKVYVAVYDVDRKSGRAKKFGRPHEFTVIKPQWSESIELPHTDVTDGKDVRIFVGRDKDGRDLLKKLELAEQEYERLYFRKFENTTPNHGTFIGAFEILDDPSQLFGLRMASVGGGFLGDLAKKLGYNKHFEGPILEEYERKFDGTDRRYFPTNESLIAKRQKLTSVITSREDLAEEARFVSRRSKKVKACITKLLGPGAYKEGEPVPKIALVFSGGGYRAMIETIGYLKGAASEEGGNILDCVTYMAGLSGSTWAINPLVASGLQPREFAQEQRRKTEVGGGRLSLKYLVDNLVGSNDPSYMERRFIESRYGQFHGAVGLYGHSLAHALLEGISVDGKDKHNITLSDLRSRLNEDAAAYPLPLSVATEQGEAEEHLTWYEFSPYYVGVSQPHGTFVDSRLFGSLFQNGVPVHAVPEYPLAQYMGIWGSAFAVSVGDIKKESRAFGFAATALGYAASFLFSTEEQETACRGRPTGGEMPNYNFEFLPNALPEELRAHPTLCLVDGGITKKSEFRHNFATVPVLARNVDMIILCDSVDSPDSDPKSEHLLSSEQEARSLNLPFPSLTGRGSPLHEEELRRMPRDVYSFFEEDGAPLVLYMKAKTNDKYNAKIREKFNPDVNAAGFTATTNFNYTPQQFDLLSGLTQSIFIQSKDKIRIGIQKTLARKIAGVAHH
jgi:phospholipase A2